MVTVKSKGKSPEEKFFDLLLEIRRHVEKGFKSEWQDGVKVKSCLGMSPAVASMLCQTVFGGKVIVVRNDGTEHWINRVSLGELTFDVDVLGDEYGKSNLQMSLVKKVSRKTEAYTVDTLPQDAEASAKALQVAVGFPADALRQTLDAIRAEIVPPLR